MAGKNMTNKVIVTTTINPPTEALIKFSEMEGWDLVIICDLKTPLDNYDVKFRGMNNVKVLSPNDQIHLNSRLSNALEWNNIQRRNFGFWYVFQHEKKYDIIATVDDDNIPNNDWGKDILIGKKTLVDRYQTNESFFDPIFTYTEGSERTWHRGFPEQLLNERKIKFIDQMTTTPLVQADFWSGDPDISAICRMSLSPNWDYSKYIQYYTGPFTTSQLTPFNSQNTFLHRNLLPYYMMLCDVGRYDDIWGAYLLQRSVDLRNKIVFNKITVQQDRNEHDLVKDLKNEVWGYENTIKLKSQSIYDLLPQITKLKYEIYYSEMKKYE
jgi:hypothetical protein